MPSATPPRSSFLLYAGACFLVAVSCLLVLGSVSISLTILAALGVIVPIVSVGGDPLHQVTWFLPFLYLYHFAVVLLDGLGLRDMAYASDVSLIGFVSITASAAVLLVSTKRRPPVLRMGDRIPVRRGLLLCAYGLLLALVIINNVAFLRSGVLSKEERNVAGVFFLGFANNWLIVVYAMYLVKRLSAGRPMPRVLIITTLGISLLSSVNLGERDMLLICLAVTGALLLAHHPVPRLVVLAGAVVVVLLVPILGQLRVMIARGITPLDVTIDDPLWVAVLQDEFISAGRNLDWLLARRHEWDFFYGSMLLRDILKGILPGALVSVPHSAGWFNETFFPGVVQRGAGYGFSYAGSWYVNFGLPGIVAGHALLGLVLAQLQRRSLRGGIPFVVYVMSIPIVIYTIRGDSAVVISYLLKQVGLPVLILLALNRVSRVRPVGAGDHPDGRVPGRRRHRSTDNEMRSVVSVEHRFIQRPASSRLAQRH